MEDGISLKLRRSSWEQIFESLSECSLGKMDRRREEEYFRDHREHFSHGNFWAAIQELQRQLEEVVAEDLEKTLAEAEEYLEGETP